MNAVSAPFFPSLVAKRRVAALWLSSGVMAVVNVALFALLGRLFGDLGVVASLSLSIAAGSAVTIIAARRFRRRLPRWIHGPEILLLAVSAVAVMAFVGPNLGPGNGAAAAGPLILATLAYATVFRHNAAFLRSIPPMSDAQRPQGDPSGVGYSVRRGAIHRSAPVSGR